MVAQVQRQETPAARFITAVFRRWQEAGIDFLVLRNYEGLPFDYGNDLDLLVAPADMARARGLLSDTARPSGFRLHNAARFAPLSLFFYRPDTGEQLQFDLFSDLSWRGLPLLEPERVLREKRSQGDFFKPKPLHEATLKLLSRLLYGGYVKDAYKADVKAAFEAVPEEAELLLADAFGPHLAEQVTTRVLAADWEGLAATKGHLQRALAWRRLRRAPGTVLLGQLREAARLLGRFRRPPGLLVAFIGPDGSGKSSVAAGLMAGLSTSFKPDKSRYIHWKPGVLVRKADSGVVTDPHGKPVRSAPLSGLYFLFHSLDFFLGGWLRVRPVLFRNGLVVVDRYYYDFFVDPRRFRLKVPGSLVALGYRLIQKPDLIFYLEASPELLQSRKQEVSLAETERQCQAYLALTRKVEGAHVLDASQPLDEVVRCALHISLAYLSGRLGARR